MGYENLLTGGGGAKTESGNKEKGGEWNGEGISPINNESTRYCPECVQESEWDGRVYECTNSECPNDGFILGFKETPHFGAPLVTLPISKEGDGKRNRFYGGEPDPIEDDNEEERQDSEGEGGLAEWL